MFLGSSFRFRQHDPSEMKLIACVLVFGFVAGAEVFHSGQPSLMHTPNASVEDVTFTLYTRRNGGNGVQIFLGDKESIKRAGFDPKLPVKVATHGYASDGHRFMSTGLMKSFLAREDCNFISVDWSRYARNVFYEQVVPSVKIVGLHVSKFVKFLNEETGFDVRDLHAMGHSMGAHVVSHIFHEFPGGKVGRITGFDPAGPIMEVSAPSERLDPEDARVVDVIHTSTSFLGSRRPLGTVDFYVNGGTRQPGCGFLDFNCEHHMSHRYFVYTVWSGKSYEAVKCDTLRDAQEGTCRGEKALMGIRADTASPGIYYSEITEAPPRLEA